MITWLQNNDKRIADRIHSVFQLSYAIEAKLLNVADFPPLKRELESYRKSDNDFFAYLKNQEFAGIAEIDHHAGFTHIQSLVVQPKFFRQGVAQKLMRFVLNSFDSKLFVVETGVKNLPATELYKKLGFKEIEQYDTNHGVRKVKFEKTIIP